MSISENIIKICGSIPQNVTLVAVSKTRSVEEIREAYMAGVRDFGENKVQELMSKIDEFGNDVNWHLIGHLQRNKVKYIVGKVHLIHSLDSIRLLEEIEKQYSLNNLIANTLIEVNIGVEESKSGIMVSELESLIKECEKCNNVKVRGLMAVIPKGDDETCKMYFSDMKKLWDKLQKMKFNNIEMQYLSMGMTGDYKMALREGSNMIRIGEGIFGKRIYNNK